MSGSSARSVVIVGASGNLAPAAVQLVASGVTVVGVARSADRPMPDGVTPVLGEFSVTPDTLVLGWTVDDVGGIRWHTPAEVSEAALAVLEDGVGRVLGAIRPWSDRPR